SRISSARSSFPACPTAGFVPSSPKNVPVPGDRKLHAEYFPIRRAPAANSASLTCSSASAGANVTSLYCVGFTSASLSGDRTSPSRMAGTVAAGGRRCTLAAMRTSGGHRAAGLKPDCRGIVAWLAAVLYTGLLLTAPCRAEIRSGESIEWLVADSDLVVRCRL